MRQYLKTYQVAGNVTPRLYDTAMEEYKFFQENPAAWSEDPDMKNPDGSFNLCLDCIKVDWTNPEHIKDAYRLIEEGYSRGTHYNHDDFVKGYQSLGLPEPVYNKAKMQSSTEGLPAKRSGGEMIRRADGSYSPRGFWDNIRDNVGSGKKPTKEMLATEEKLKKENGGSFDDDSKLRELFQRMFKKDDSNSEALNIDPEKQDSPELQYLKEFAKDPGEYYSDNDLAIIQQNYQDARNKELEERIALRESQPKFRREDYPPVVKKGKTLFGRPYQEVYTQIGPDQFGEVTPGISKIRTVYYKNGNIAKQTIDGSTTFHDINGKVTAQGSANPFGHSGYMTFSNGYFDQENNVDYETAKRREEEIGRVGSDNALGAFFKYLKMNGENLSRKGSQPGVSYTADWGTFPDWSTFTKTENPRPKRSSVKFEDGGIHIDPSKKGTFKAQATRMGMSVSEAASHILANKEEYSPEMVKKAVFAHNFASQYGGLVDDFDKYMDGGKIELPKAVVGAVVPIAMQLLGSGAVAGAGAGAAAGATGAGSAIAGAAGKSAITGAAKSGLMSGIKNQFANAQNSPSINSSNLAGAAALPDTGPLSWLKAAVGAGTALSSVASTITHPTGGGMLGKFAGKSDFGTPKSVMQTQKLGAPEKQNIQPDYSNTANTIANSDSFKNYGQFMGPRAAAVNNSIDAAQTFGNVPFKTQVGPVAEFGYGGHLPMYQGVDMFGNFTTGIVGNNVGMQMNMNEMQNVLNQAVGAKTVDQSYANNTANILAKDAAAEENRKSIQAAIAEQNKKPESPIQPTGSTPNTGFDKTMGFISGMNMFNTVLEANQNKKARQKWERQNSYNTDSTYNPMVVDNPFGLYDPNTGQMKPGSKVATQDFGTTGVAKCGGQKMYRQGGTYMLTKDQIMDILAKGGEIEFI